MLSSKNISMRPAILTAMRAMIGSACWTKPTAILTSKCERGENTLKRLVKNLQTGDSDSPLTEKQKMMIELGRGPK